MKKIMFYISTLFFGGAERVMTVLANNLSQKEEYEIIFVTTYAREKEYALNDKIRRYNLEKIPLKGNFICKNIKRIHNLREILKKEKPDILVSFMAEPNFRAILASIFLKNKVVISVRNDPYKEYPKALFLLAQILFRFADGCIFQTEDAKECFNKSIRRKSQIILNPVSEQFYSAKREEHVKNIIAVGRLEKQKNFELLIMAYSQIAKRYPEDYLLIYGQGSRKEALEELIRKLGLEQRVFLMGSTNNVQDILKKAKIFVMSSDFEGLPNALMEAIAVGVPVISTDCPCGGPKMLIENKINGFLVPVGSKEKLALAMEIVLENDEIRSKFSKKNLEKREFFREQYVIEKWMDFLDVVENRK